MNGYRFQKTARKIAHRRPLLYPVRISGSPSGSVGRSARSRSSSSHCTLYAPCSNPGRSFFIVFRDARARAPPPPLSPPSLHAKPYSLYCTQLVRKLVPIARPRIKVSPLSTTIYFYRLSDLSSSRKSAKSPRSPIVRAIN